MNVDTTESNTVTTQPTKDDVDQYIQDVLDETIVVGEFVKFAVQRHVKDLEKVKDDSFPFWFDKTEAQWVCKCFPSLFRHSAGELAGQPFELMPWQSFIIQCVFGWKIKASGLRRFRRVYIEVGRRNGKSTLGAAIALFMLALDGEPSAQVYSAATKLDQAKIVWTDARKMVRASPDLNKEIVISQNCLAIPSTESRFIPLASDSKGLDGLNISAALVDELHAHPTRDVWDLLDTGTGSREQPLIFIITTAGFNQQGICYELRSMIVDILTEKDSNEQWFGFIAAIDQNDNYLDETVWEKSNPNIRFMTTLLPDLREKANRAKNSVAAQNNFLIKHMCRWTAAGNPWIRLSEWDACKSRFTYEDMLGRPCFAGMDLAEVSDLTCICACFPPITKEENWRFLWKCYLPEAAIERYSKDGKYRWNDWVNDGELIAVEGAIDDHQQAREELQKWASDFDLRIVGFDPYHAKRTVGELIDDGLNMVEIPQRYQHLTEGTKQFEALIRAGQLEHNGESLIRWQMENAQLLQDNEGNSRPHRPDRNSNVRKVDAVLAAVMATSVAIRNPIDTTPTSYQIFSL